MPTLFSLTTPTCMYLYYMHCIYTFYICTVFPFKDRAFRFLSREKENLGTRIRFLFFFTAFNERKSEDRWITETITEGKNPSHIRSDYLYISSISPSFSHKATTPFHRNPKKVNGFLEYLYVCVTVYTFLLCVWKYICLSEKVQSLWFFQGPKKLK